MLRQFALIFSLASFSNALYTIPEANVQAFTPRGFSISIADSPGVDLVGFHVNINKELERRGPGEFSVDLTRVAHDGKWTFYVPTLRLKIGDIIHYWIQVSRNRIGYRGPGETFEITELKTMETENPLDDNQPQSGTCTPCKINDGKEVFTTPPTVTGNFNICSDIIVNSTKNILSLQSRIDQLTNTNQQLVGLIETYPDAKQLHLSGRIPLDGEAADTARFLIREKLELSPNIGSARRNIDGSITFEVATLLEKLEILEVAKKNLKDSRIYIMP